MLSYVYTYGDFAITVCSHEQVARSFRRDINWFVSAALLGDATGIYESLPGIALRILMHIRTIPCQERYEIVGAHKLRIHSILG